MEMVIPEKIIILNTNNNIININQNNLINNNSNINQNNLINNN